MSPEINIGDIVKSTQSEGPGLRYAIWVQGCPLRCKGCCNPHLLEFKDAQKITVDALLQDIISQTDIEGVTFVGGEPFSQAKALGELSFLLKKAGLNTMAFSGFTLEELYKDEQNKKFLDNLDVLIDGPFRADMPEKKRRWIGSSNQRIHYLTNALKGRFELSGNSVELKMKGMEISIHGYPLKFVTKELRKK